MWYPAKITTVATAEPVSLDEAKKQCNATGFTDDDDLLTRLTKAARNHVERYCGVRFASQTVEVKCDCFADFARLSEAPAQSISSVGYVDTAGDDKTLGTDIYELRADDLEASIALVYGKQWPAIHPRSRITVTAVVGYATAPDAVKQAMLLLIADWYANRENTVIGAGVAELPMPSSIDALLCNFRRGV